MKSFALKKIKYILTSQHRKGHGIHSPFVFSLIQNVFRQKPNAKDVQPIEDLRKYYLLNEEIITVEDYGAGSRYFKTSTRRLKDIAKISVKPRKYGQLLYCLVKYYKPASILELGISIGITTAYLAKANPEAKIVSIEGCKNLASIAQTNLTALGIQNVTIVNGLFSEVMPLALFDLQKPDMVFFDGHHTYEATLHYFEIYLRHKHPEAILIFDDIHWSDGMEAAWQEIINHPEVTLSIDIFELGLIFFSPKLSKQNIVIRY